MKITLSRAAFIAAASVVQGTQDIRYCLNGILIEKGPDNKPLIVATDGHRLFAAIDENGELSDDMPAQVIIKFGTDTLRAVKLAKHRDHPIFITVEDDRVTVHISQDARCPGFGRDTTDSVIIDGKFPDWHRVIKDSRKRAIGWYDSAYLADFAKVVKFLKNDNGKGHCVTLRANDKNSAATVHFAGIDYAFGILMPIRTDIDNPSLPAWSVAGPFKKAA